MTGVWEGQAIEQDAADMRAQVRALSSSTALSEASSDTEMLAQLSAQVRPLLLLAVPHAPRALHTAQHRPWRRRSLHSGHARS